MIYGPRGTLASMAKQTRERVDSVVQEDEATSKMILVRTYLHCGAT